MPSAFLTRYNATVGCCAVPSLCCNVFLIFLGSPGFCLEGWWTLSKAPFWVSWDDVCSIVLLIYVCRSIFESRMKTTCLCRNFSLWSWIQSVNTILFPLFIKTLPFSCICVWFLYQGDPWGESVFLGLLPSFLPFIFLVVSFLEVWESLVLAPLSNQFLLNLSENSLILGLSWVWGSILFQSYCLLYIYLLMCFNYILLI